jgi:DNA polymerase-3 subunit alpha
MNAVAITDHGNLYGASSSTASARRVASTPSLATRLTWRSAAAPTGNPRRDDPETDDAIDSAPTHHPSPDAVGAERHRVQEPDQTVVARLSGGYHRKPRIDKELLERHSEGLICSSACAAAEFSEYILTDRPTEAEQLAVWFQKVFGKNFYIEIQNNGLEIQRLRRRGHRHRQSPRHSARGDE